MYRVSPQQIITVQRGFPAVNQPGPFVNRQSKSPEFENGVCQQPRTRTQGFCRSQHTSKQSVLFENLSTKAVIATFEQDHTGSDGEAVLRKAVVLNAPGKEEEGKAFTDSHPDGTP